MTRQWTYTINAPEKWLNVNDRPKWRPDTLIAEWKHRSSGIAQYMKIPRLERCTITALLAFPDENRRRDAANYYPSIKAAIDGMVLAGVLEDDDDRFVLALTIARMPFRKGDHGPKGAMQLTICEVTA